MLGDIGCNNTKKNRKCIPKMKLKNAFISGGHFLLFILLTAKEMASENDGFLTIIVKNCSNLKERLKTILLQIVRNFRKDRNNIRLLEVHDGNIHFPKKRLLTSQPKE